MTLAELIAAARNRAFDNSTPPLWSDAEWTSFANDAEREACRRARLIVDSTSCEIVEIRLRANGKTYDQDQRILFIRRAKLSGTSRPLGRASYKDLDRCAPDWEDETGEPRAYVTDMDTNKFRPYPTPTEAGVVKMTVVRLPLEDMVDTDDEPEIRPHLHESLLFWMLYRAYSKQDAETKDDGKASANLALFENEFGKKSSAIDETWIQHEQGALEDEGYF